VDDVVVETMAEVVLVVTGVEVIELVWEVVVGAVVICDELAVLIVVDGIVIVVEPFS
jgi:hypothetical protein